MHISISKKKISQLYLFFFSFLIILSSCGSNTNTKEVKNELVDATIDSAEENLDEKEDRNKEKTEKYIGEQFGYRIKLPADCVSRETSDGYSLELKSGVKLSIYTETIVPELIDIMGENCSNGLEFQFSPEYIGTQCVNDTSSIFSIDIDNKRHFFMVKSWSILSVTLKANVTTFLKSVTFLKEDNDETTA